MSWHDYAYIGFFFKGNFCHLGLSVVRQCLGAKGGALKSSDCINKNETVTTRLPETFMETKIFPVLLNSLGQEGSQEPYFPFFNVILQKTNSLFDSFIIRQHSM